MGIDHFYAGGGQTAPATVPRGYFPSLPRMEGKGQSSGLRTGCTQDREITKCGIIVKE